MSDALWFLAPPVAFLIYMWSFGHLFGWGAFKEHFLVDKHSLKDLGDVKGSDVGILQHGKWVGGWSAVRINITQDKITLRPEKWITWALPPIELPIESISSFSLERHLLVQWLRIDVSDCDGSLLLPKKHEPRIREACQSPNM